MCPNRNNHASISPLSNRIELKRRPRRCSLASYYNFKVVACQLLWLACGQVIHRIDRLAVEANFKMHVRAARMTDVAHLAHRVALSDKRVSLHQRPFEMNV